MNNINIFNVIKIILKYFYYFNYFNYFYYFYKIPNYNVDEIHLQSYNNKIRKIILNNFKNYIKLTKFDCYNCNLTELHDLPNSLIYLDCCYNNLTKLPDLPNSLTQLCCSNNNLIELPELPNSLTYLYRKVPNLRRTVKCHFNPLLGVK